MATDVVRRRVEDQRGMATGVVRREWRDGSSPIFFCFFHTAIRGASACSSPMVLQMRDAKFETHHLRVSNDPLGASPIALSYIVILKRKLLTVQTSTISKSKECISEENEDKHARAGH
jgi:hypothetical protein